VTGSAIVKEPGMRVINGILIVDDLLLKMAGIPTKAGTVLVVGPGSAYCNTVVLRYHDQTKRCPVCKELACECEGGIG
jgi:hypothetical protein